MYNNHDSLDSIQAQLDATAARLQKRQNEIEREAKLDTIKTVSYAIGTLAGIALTTYITLKRTKNDKK